MDSVGSEWNPIAEYFEHGNDLLCSLKLVTFVEIKCQLDATDDFYCRSYCLLNMFRAPLCPSSGAREYYTSGCCLSYLVLGFQVVNMVWSWGLCVRFAGCCVTAQHLTDHVFTSEELKEWLALLASPVPPDTQNRLSRVYYRDPDYRGML